jgi:lipopolysaccharide export system permease protein
MHHTCLSMYKKNILYSYFNFDVLKNTLSILGIFLVLVVGSRLIGYFEEASMGNIDPNIIIKVLVLRLPDFINLLIPLSLFLGVILSVSRLYADKEIFGFLASGHSSIKLIKFLIPQLFILFFLTACISFFIAPYSKELSESYLNKNTFEDELKNIKPNELMIIPQNGFLKIKDKSNNFSFQDAILFIENNKQSQLIQGDAINFEEGNERIQIQVTDGVVFSIAEDGGVITSKFKNLNTNIKNSYEKPAVLTLQKIYDFENNKDKNISFNWNISIPISLLILSLLGVFISKVSPRKGRFSVILPGILVYILYLSLLIFARELMLTNEVFYMLGLWWVHGIFLFILLIYSWNDLGLKSLKR